MAYRIYLTIVLYEHNPWIQINKAFISSFFFENDLSQQNKGVTVSSISLTTVMRASMSRMMFSKTIEGFDQAVEQF